MKLFLSDDTVQVSLVENQYTIANVDDAVKVVYSNTTAAEVADAVWDEPMSQHSVIGSFGKRLKEILPTLWGVK